MSDDVCTLVGIDHGFSFPLCYFEKYGLTLDWRAFLDDFCEHWPTDEDRTPVDFVRKGLCGKAAARCGNSRWRRMTELRCGSAKSVFHFDVQGSVAKSTHAGLPWLRFIAANTTRPVHFWPFDGWEVRTRSSAVVEVYPRLWNRAFAVEDRNPDQHDAYVTAAWLQRADASGELVGCLHPNLTDGDRRIAAIEGWILGLRE